MIRLKPKDQMTRFDIIRVGKFIQTFQNHIRDNNSQGKELEDYISLMKKITVVGSSPNQEPKPDAKFGYL